MTAETPTPIGAADIEARKLLYYALEPVYEHRSGDPWSISTAALVHCIATGRTLAGMGGPGYALAPEIVDALDMRKTGGKPRLVCDAEDFDEMNAQIARLTAERDQARAKAIEECAREAEAHDSSPEVSPEEDPIANAHQWGYRTARDQIAASIRALEQEKAS